MLYTPASGQNILRWAKEATREINSNRIQNGLGVLVTRTPNGTNLVVHPGKGGKGATATSMPFDCQLVEHEADSLAFTVHVLCGKLFYAIANGVMEIPPADLIGEDYWNLDLTLTDNLTIGIQCNYDEEDDETNIPESFTVSEIPYDPYDTQDGWLDANGLHYFPLVRFIKFGPEQEYEGPYIFSIQVPHDGEGQGTEEQEFDTYYAIQSHHGDVYFDNNDCAAWIGEVRSGSNGTFAVSIADSSGTDADTIHAVELAGSCTFPYGSRVIVHRILTESLASGDMGGDENEGE